MRRTNNQQNGHDGHIHLHNFKNENEKREYVFAMEELLVAAQELMRARDLEDIMEVARIAGRQLTGADGATFVLKDGENCFYADENAVGPLWKGKRFPLGMCISGWVMNNKKAVAIPDIYKDERIPHDAYRPTFVKSLMMVPVGRYSPVAAIGNYWSFNHRPSDEELSILQSLADMVALAMDNICDTKKLQDRIAELEKNKDMAVSI